MARLVNHRRMWGKTCGLLLILYSCASSTASIRSNHGSNNSSFEIQTITQHRKEPSKSLGRTIRNAENEYKSLGKQSSIMIETLDEENFSKSIERQIVNAAGSLERHLADEILKTESVMWLDLLPSSTKDFGGTRTLSVYELSNDVEDPSVDTQKLKEPTTRDIDFAYHHELYSDWGRRIIPEDVSVTIVPSEVIPSEISEGPQQTVEVRSSVATDETDSGKLEEKISLVHLTEPGSSDDPDDMNSFKYEIKPSPTQSNLELSELNTIEIINPSSVVDTIYYKGSLSRIELKSSVLEPTSDTSKATPVLISRYPLSDRKETELKETVSFSTRSPIIEQSVKHNEQIGKFEIKSTVPDIRDPSSNTIRLEPDDLNILNPKYNYSSEIDSTETSSRTNATQYVTHKPTEEDKSQREKNGSITDMQPITSTNPTDSPQTPPPNTPLFVNESISRSPIEDYPLLVKLTLQMSWSEFNSQAINISQTLARLLGDELPLVKQNQIRFLEPHLDNRTKRESSISVYLYVSNEDGKYDQELTKTVGSYLGVRLKEYSGHFRGKILNASVFEPTSKVQVTRNAQSPLHNSGIIAGIAISVIAGLSLIALFVMLLVFKHKMQPSQSMLAANLDAYTLDSLGDRGSNRRKKGRLSLRSFLNQAFDDPEMPSHPLSFSNLSTIINSKQALEEEFKKLPAPLPLLEEVPPGAEAKNRFANVIPNPETRVKLTAMTNTPNSDYINANFIKGYGGRANVYIATQAPLKETLNDFWRMIWEQQSRTILMLTQLEENGTSRCVAYFPDNTHDCQRVYGDFQVTLLSKDVRESFTVSTFRLLDLERNLFRDIVHLWFTAWPNNNVFEDPGALMNFILDMKNHIHGNAGPTVVHCSPGTGRTGAVIAIDILMKEYDESRIIDVQRCVTRLRQDRHGAVNTLEQYILIHEVLHEYILKLGTQSQRPSLKSLMSLKLPSLS